MNAFSAWVGLGAVVGLWRVARSASQRQQSMWVNAGLFLLAFILAGSRLFYVLVNWGYFSIHLLEAPQVWNGGLGWPGAVAGAGLALFFLGLQYRSSRTRPPNLPPIPLGWLADRLYPLFPPLVVTIWLGCWQVGVAYGQTLPAGTFGGVPSLDENGVYSLRFPLQPLAALTLLIFFAVLEARPKSPRPAGRLSGLAVTGLLLSMLASSLLRADPAPYWHGLRLDTWMAVIYLAFFFALIILNTLFFRIRRRLTFHNPEQIPS